MADDILKSYLVAIGFKLDEQDYKKFKDSQLDTEKRTKNLSKAFSDFAKIGIGSATALGGTVIKVSSDLEKLHFQAQKSGTSAQNLKAFGDAAAQIGIQSEEAMGLVEAFGNKIASGKYAGALNFLGVKQDKDSIKTLLDLVDSLSRANPIVQESFAEQFGISGEDIRTLIRGREELHKYYQERRQVYADIDQQSLAAHKANEEFRDLEARFSALTATVGTTFLPLAKNVVSILEVVVKDLQEADKATDGWSSKLLALTAAIGGTIGGLKALGMLKGLFGAGGASGAGSTAALGVAGAGVLGGALANWGINIKADEYDIRAKENFDSVANQNRSEIAMGRLFTQETGMDRLTHGLEYSAWLAKKKTGRKISSVTDSGELNNPGNLRSWGSVPTVEKFRGSTSIGSFAKFSSVDEGLQAMAGLLSGKGYAGSGINTIAGILNKYAPAKENNTAAYIADVAGRTGFDPSSHLNLSNVDTLSRLMGAMIHHEQGRDPYSMSMITDSANKRLKMQASGNTVSVKMDQKTEINVNGSGDANKTADLVASEQNKVNSGLARDFAGAFQ